MVWFCPNFQMNSASPKSRITVLSESDSEDRVMHGQRDATIARERCIALAKLQRSKIVLVTELTWHTVAYLTGGAEPAMPPGRWRGL